MSNTSPIQNNSEWFFPSRAWDAFEKNLVSKPGFVNKVKDLRVQRLVDNGKFLWREAFCANMGGRSLQIVYHHSKDEPKDNAVEFTNSYCSVFNDLLNVWGRFITDGSLVIDIGANDADTALPLAFLAGPTGVTYAFEPGEQFALKFNVNAGSNPFLNIRGEALALMPTTGISEFLYDPTNYNGGHPSTNAWVGTYTEKRLVRTVSFKDYFLNKNISKLSFVKIDTEGHDFPILWSFKEVLRDLRPTISAEWFPRTDPMIRDLAKYLDYETYCGFSLEPITLGRCAWRQDVVLAPREKREHFNLKNHE